MINEDKKHVEYLMSSLETKEHIIDQLQCYVLDSQRHIHYLFESNCQLRQQIAELQSKKKVK